MEFVRTSAGKVHLSDDGFKMRCGQRVKLKAESLGTTIRRGNHLPSVWLCWQCSRMGADQKWVFAYTEYTAKDDDE